MSNNLSGISMEEAQELMLYENLNFVKRLGSEIVDIEDALGRVTASTVVLKKGSKISASAGSLLAEQGMDAVEVYKPLKTGILCVENDTISENSRETKIITGMLNAYFRENNFSVIKLGNRNAQLENIEKTLDEAIEKCDALMIACDMVKNHEVIKEALLNAGGRIVFEKVQMTPGTEMMAAMINHKPIFILPETTAAAFSDLQLIILPVLRSMAGMRQIFPKRIQVKMLDDYDEKNLNRQMLFGQLLIKNGEAYFIFSAESDEKMPISSCELLAEIPVDRGVVYAGEIVFAYDLTHLSEKRY